MKALTLWQPWASLLACGAKKYETRSWATSYRGLIAIHAAAKSISSILKDCFPCHEWDFHPSHAAYTDFVNAAERSLGYSITDLSRGAVIATAELVNCWYIVYHPGTNVDKALRIPIGAESMTKDKHASDFGDYFVPTEQEMLFGNWTPGRYAWEFANVKILDVPIPAKGGQRIWNWKDKI
jgi:hypothetical protein